MEKCHMVFVYFHKAILFLLKILRFSSKHAENISSSFSLCVSLHVAGLIQPAEDRPGDGQDDDT